MVVTFIGHRKIQFDNGFRLQLKKLLLSLIDNRNADTFLFGSRSDFDDLCLEVVTEIKKERPGIKRVYVRAEYPYISRDYENYLPGSYDATYIPDNDIDAGKAAYVERNFHMIDKAGLCIFITTKTTSLPSSLPQEAALPANNLIVEQKSHTSMRLPKEKKFLICFLHYNKRRQHKCFMRP